jgi:hypothetical protein
MSRVLFIIGKQEEVVLSPRGREEGERETDR